MTKERKTYAAETRAETSVTKRKMRTAEMKILRTIKGITLHDRTTGNAGRRHQMGKRVGETT